MKRQHVQLAAAGAVVVSIGLFFAGVSPAVLVLLGAALLMIFMHAGHGGRRDAARRDRPGTPDGRRRQ
ncbi:hypothetical protein FHX69_0071 [Prauserella muralis]|nr:hypothetical protein FHX69_0071 [Prauserella muralis]